MKTLLRITLSSVLACHTIQASTLVQNEFKDEELKAITRVESIDNLSQEVKAPIDRRYTACAVISSLFVVGGTIAAGFLWPHDYKAPIAPGVHGLDTYTPSRTASESFSATYDKTIPNDVMRIQEVGQWRNPVSRTITNRWEGRRGEILDQLMEGYEPNNMYIMKAVGTLFQDQAMTKPYRGMIAVGKFRPSPVLSGPEIWETCFILQAMAVYIPPYFLVGDIFQTWRFFYQGRPYTFRSQSGGELVYTPSIYGGGIATATGGRGFNDGQYLCQYMKEGE